MATVVRVAKISEARAAMPPPQRRKKTPCLPAGKRPTWFAPKSDPNGRERLEAWDLFSRDGLWHYQRVETGVRPVWLAIYLPTGQYREFSSKDYAREETYAGLADQLAREAYTLALLGEPDDPQRADGQRLLAIHMRVAGRTRGQDTDLRCTCGGYLAVVTSGGALGHVDACESCYTHGQGLPQQSCPKAGGHRFCGAPARA